ncbi:MAG: hypothetical protein ABIG89_04995 [Candidatus Woesearchaeota archaeon]
MVKNHLKRLNCPKTWAIEKKQNTFITRPMTTGQRLEFCLPLSTVLRDILKIGKNLNEIKHIINNNDVLVNGKKIIDVKYALGFLDVLDIKALNESYRLIIGNNGKLKLVTIDDKEKNILLLKIINKTIMKGGKLQINFSNGMNLLIDDVKSVPCKIDDVVVYDFMNKKILDVLAFENNASVYFVGGKFIGSVVKVESIKKKENIIVFRTLSNDVLQTSLDYAYLIGKDKPLIKIE